MLRGMFLQDKYTHAPTTTDGEVGEHWGHNICVYEREFSRGLSGYESVYEREFRRVDNADTANNYQAVTQHAQNITVDKFL